MASFPEIETTTQVRARLTAITAEFREKGAAAAPVCFGSHRRPEAVIVPAALFERLLPFLRDEGFDLPATPLPRLDRPAKRRSIPRPGRAAR